MPLNLAINTDSMASRAACSSMTLASEQPAYPQAGMPYQQRHRQATGHGDRSGAARERPWGVNHRQLVFGPE